ncbi:MAG: UPF0280 family protein [Desulfarculus sp.]|nr:UPF0280 family protein [Desulfarculus sp.]
MDEQYQERSYRVDCGARGLTAFTARVKETDLWIRATADLGQRAVESILDHRRGLEAYVREHPDFLVALTPLPMDPLAPPLVRAMLAAGQAAGVGPMAAVAGAVAQAVAGDLLTWSPQVVVENGGDVYLALAGEATVGLWAGDSPISGRVGLRIPAEQMPIAVCTSSGTVGHSLSLGRADAATILARDAALADAAATALGNRVRGPDDLAQALDWAQGVPGVLGALAVKGSRLAAWGEVELVRL